MTRGAKTSTWPGLIADGVEHVSRRDPDQGALLRLRLDSAKTTEDLISIAQDLKRHLNRDFGRWIAKAAGGLQPHNKVVGETIGRLNAPILTTNYDDLLERVTNLPSASWDKPDEMRALLTNSRPAIGHLHGVWRDSESVIFSEGDYRRVTEDPAAQDVQTSAFNMKTFLFIGVGEGLNDPNFSPMVKNFAERFTTASDSHFRLCRDQDVDLTTELKTVVDIGYGEDFEDLPVFLEQLAMSGHEPTIDLMARSKSRLLDRLRDNSTLWRDADTLDEKSLTDLVIPPIFLPEPHDQYATNSVVNTDKDKPSLVDLTGALRGGGIVVIAGEEYSGVSTAITYCLSQALDFRSNAHTILIDEPLVPGIHPVGRVVDRTYREWDVTADQVEIRSQLLLGVDNLRFEESERFKRAIGDICNSDGELAVIGVRQSDVLEIVNALKEKSTRELTVVYLGRFSSVEARELARRVAPGREDAVANSVMIVVREKNLPRTPFTITLLVELVQSGVLLQKEESEIAVLDQYLNLLLSADFIRTRGHLQMTLRNKRLVLESLARKFVEEREDKAPQAKVIEWLSDQFAELGWDHDALLCINDLIDRRVLARAADNTIRFQRSAYLELMAGLAARDDSSFRKLVFGFPLQLASIVRTYAAMTRNDAEVLEIVEKEIERITVAPPSGAVFGSVRRLEVVKELFSDESESEPGEVDPQGIQRGEDAVGRDGLNKQYYDDSDDSDTPAFLTARLEDLSHARVAMLVVDLASRVLRDSDEVRDQKLKERILRKLLVAWVAFTDLYEMELAQAPDLDEVVAELFEERNPTSEDLEGLKSLLVRVAPSFLTESGIRYCLSGPSLVTRLAELDMSGMENGSFALLMRTLALYTSGSLRWVDSLRSLDDLAVKSFFSASFFASLARYAYMVDERLSEEQRGQIRHYLRRVIGARYNFRSQEHRNSVLNDFENSLRRARLQETKRSRRQITMSV
ncbi:SIR2 family protein [Diaminobutyricimonas sp. TR449]|uniref:SIR2 family NAD-dependent protein deacylase n=1 Tax=Diaminobutyricimonas sp. TR449 TaxID=2708076 RepID=UPI00142205EB|nr:SIR2 family protein [Diaminobutyricimonas sp. TR449]